MLWRAPLNSIFILKVHFSYSYYGQTYITARFQLERVNKSVKAYTPVPSYLSTLIF